MLIVCCAGLTCGWPLQCHEGSIQWWSAWLLQVLRLCERTTSLTMPSYRVVKGIECLRAFLVEALSP
jgi:hypothetical protein